MHKTTNIRTMPSLAPPRPWSLSELERVRRAIVVIDVVESVRLMQEDEAGFIERWRWFVHQVRTEVLPGHGGRMVKSLGDGMLLEFAAVPMALGAAFAVQSLHRGALPDAGFHLRLGIHCADVAIDDVDIFGSGVNLASRLAGLAGPDEIVASVDVRDQLVAGMDADIDDLGDCFLKHIDEPVRAFRIAAPGARGHLSMTIAAAPTNLRPTIVVLPMRALSAAGAESMLGEIIADDLIAALARSAQWNVISRLSAATLRARDAQIGELRRMFGASHILSGQFHCLAGNVRLSLELADARDAHVLWSDVRTCAVDALFSGHADVLADVVAQVSSAVLSKNLHRSGQLALPNLESYAVLMQGVGLMHRMSPRESDRASDALEHLVQRHPRAPEPRAWLGKWHVMRVAQAWTSDPQVEARHARAVVARALDLLPSHPLSLAIDGLIYAMVERDLGMAERRYEEALAANPNEAHAWLYLSSVHAHRGDGARARRCMARARAASPLDPLDYFYDIFDAWAALAAGDYADAERLALRSHQLNRQHLPTFTVLSAAHALAGHPAEARTVGRQLLALRPGFSVARFVAQFPGGPSAHARRLGDALLEAELPA
jgi:adenylate cyclase